jgi:hypothetical protein
MTLLTDDMDLNNNQLLITLGGNGDYYITVISEENNLKQYNSVRIAMSGGNASTNVKNAVAKLYIALEENNLN